MYASGSLGQGLSFGCGIALGLKLRNKKRKVFVLVGDGEMQEGQIWEALLFASHHKLNNLYLLIDKNNIQDFEFVDNIISLGQLSSKIKSFGFDVNTCKKGNDLKHINKSFVFKNSKKPKCIIF
jgi:transketolase